MIAIIAVILAALATFGVSVTRLAYQETFRSETEQAAQRAAEATASAVAKRVYLRRPESEVTEAGADEALTVATANVQLGRVERAAVRWSGPAPAYLARVEVQVVSTYGGFAGPITFEVVAAATVSWSEPP